MRATTLAAGGLACAGAAMTIAAFAGAGERTTTTAATPTPAATAAASDGLTVFVAQGCGSCHRFAPAESVGPIGPDLTVALQGKDREWVKGKIVAPTPGGMMPEDFAVRIRPPDLERLVTFLLSAQ